jgi:excisionase family DNA binding protein
MNSKLLTIDQVAEYLNVHRDTVYNLVRSGRLPAMQLGGRKASWRITEEDLLEFVASAKAANGSNGTSSAEAMAEFDRAQNAALEAFKDSQDSDRAKFMHGRRPLQT